MMIVERSFLNTILIIESARKQPTPTPIVAIKRVGSTAARTCSASTDKSGSATVMSTPITKHTETSNCRRLDLARPEPTCSPIGVMARSAPRLKSPMPTIKKIAQIEKTTSCLKDNDTSGVHDTASTISVTGKTEPNASFNLSSKILNICGKYRKTQENAHFYNYFSEKHATSRHSGASKGYNGRKSDTSTP